MAETNPLVYDFGREWAKFSEQTGDEQRAMFDAYFKIFPWTSLPAQAVGFDLGCGSGRWAYFVAPRVGKLYCIDPSPEALNVARHNLAHSCCEFLRDSAEHLSIADSSCDFGYSLGVIHHVPDATKALKQCASKLKPEAPFLLYLYYRFEDRPVWFRGLWTLSNALRNMVSRLPFPVKSILCDMLAALIYWPLAKLAKLFDAQNFPLYFYRNRSFYVMRNDCLDRFGTRVENRFTREEIRAMLIDCGFHKIQFSENEPFWVALAYRH